MYGSPGVILRHPIPQVGVKPRRIWLEVRYQGDFFQESALTFQEPLVFDELRHPRPEEFLTSFLRFTIGKEHVPETVDLILDVLGMCHKRFLVMPEDVAFFFGVFFVLTEIRSNLHKPNSLCSSQPVNMAGTGEIAYCADEHVEVLRVWLHVRYGLD